MVEFKALATALLSRKVALSGIVFAFAGAFLHAQFPTVFGPLADKYYFIAGCFVLGGAFQRTTESVVRYLFSKPTKQIDYYESLQELHRDFARGLIPEDTYRRVADRLIEKHFLGDDSKALPPGS